MLIFFLILYMMLLCCSFTSVIKIHSLFHSKIDHSFCLWFQNYIYIYSWKFYLSFSLYIFIFLYWFIFSYFITYFYHSKRFSVLRKKTIVFFLLCLMCYNLFFVRFILYDSVFDSCMLNWWLAQTYLKMVSHMGELNHWHL